MESQPFDMLKLGNTIAVRCGCYVTVLKEEALNVYLSGKVALEDAGFGDNFEMMPGCSPGLLQELHVSQQGQCQQT